MKTFLQLTMIFLTFYTNISFAENIDGQWVKSPDREFLCADGSPVGIPDTVVTRDYLWTISNSVLTISFVPEVNGESYSAISIDYSLTLVEDTYTAVPISTEVATQTGASSFNIILEGDELVALRNGSAIYCNGDFSSLYMIKKNYKNDPTS